MSREYSPKEIEKKWQDIWDNEEAFKATLDKSKPKYYALVEFPYPSGQGSSCRPSKTIYSNGYRIP